MVGINPLISIMVVMKLIDIGCCIRAHACACSTRTSATTMTQQPACGVIGNLQLAKELLQCQSYGPERGTEVPGSSLSPQTELLDSCNADSAHVGSIA